MTVRSSSGIHRNESTQLMSQGEKEGNFNRGPSGVGVPALAGLDGCPTDSNSKLIEYCKLSLDIFEPLGAVTHLAVRTIPASFVESRLFRAHLLDFEASGIETAGPLVEFRPPREDLYVPT